MMARLRALGAEGRRRIIQVLAAVLYNANFGGFLKGEIYQGQGKKFCVPGLNCYSCPGAIAACPLGALQASLNSFPKAVPLYTLGILLLFGALLGRAICAFLCPFGLIQELLYKIPTKKLKKSAWTRRLTVIKYIVLVVMVIALPLYFLIVNGVVTPAFCKWLCPAGTLEGGVPLMIADGMLRAQAGWLFSLEGSGDGGGDRRFDFHLPALLPLPLPAGRHLFPVQPHGGIRRAAGQEKVHALRRLRARLQDGRAHRQRPRMPALRGMRIPLPDRGDHLQVHRIQRRKDP